MDAAVVRDLKWLGVAGIFLLSSGVSLIRFNLCRRAMARGQKYPVFRRHAGVVTIVFMLSIIFILASIVKYWMGMAFPNWLWAVAVLWIVYVSKKYQDGVRIFSELGLEN